MVGEHSVMCCVASVVLSSVQHNCCFASITDTLLNNSSWILWTAMIKFVVTFSMCNKFFSPFYSCVESDTRGFKTKHSLEQRWEAICYHGQWRSQNEAEEAMAHPETNLLRFLLVFCINFQLLEKCKRLTTSLTGPSRIILLAELLITGRMNCALSLAGRKIN